MSVKIEVHHLERYAIVYPRQSSPTQVRNNRESPLRQLALKRRAEELGWPTSQVLVLEEGGARSASSTEGRSAFHQLNDLIRAHRVGIILAVEVARWARDGVVWQWLLRDCAYEKVLLSDEHQVYDPNDPKDFMVLGIQGVLAKHELSQIRERTTQCWWNKARRGELFCCIPTGFVLVDGKLEKDPHRRVQSSFERLFKKFEDCTSVVQLCRFFLKKEELLPFVAHGDDPQHLQWKPVTYKRLLNILKNPAYAGAYVIGRRKKIEVRNDNGEIVRRTVYVSRKDWEVLQRDRFEGYITWEQYEQNMAKIQNNDWSQESAGASRRGTPLLSGFLRCQRCGSALHIHYPRSQRPSYVCRGGARQREGGKACLRFSSPVLESLFSEMLLEVVRPAALEATRQASQRMADESRQERQVLADQLQQLEYEAERARRQYDRVEPEYRLVAGELERRWNETLQAADAQRERLRQFDEQHPTKSWDDSLASWFGLHRLDEVWSAASNERKKQIVDVLVREIVVDVSETGDEILLWIHWHGGHHTLLTAPCARRGTGPQREVKEAITLLRLVSDDANIARSLNRHAIRPPNQKKTESPNWTAKSVRQFRERHSIPPHDPSEKLRRNLLTSEEASRKLGISAMSVHRLISAGILPAERTVPGLPNIIQSRHLALPEVQEAVQRILSNLPRPLTEDSRQQKLF